MIKPESISIMKEDDKITVIIPTYNSARFLAESIESILEQTVQNLHLAILDGGSKDATIDIAKAYAVRDERISLHSYIGVHPTARIDDFVKKITTPYFALQHSDDISYKNRLEKQINAFENDPELGACSCAYRSFWHDRSTSTKPKPETIHKKPEKHEEIRANLVFWWVMHSPAIAFRTQQINNHGLGFYNKFQFGNDYLTNLNFIEKIKYHNIQDELCAYRIHSESDGAKNMEALRKEEIELKRQALSHFGFSFTEHELEIHTKIRLLPDGIIDAISRQEFDEIITWLNKLVKMNNSSKKIDPAIFNKLVTDLIKQSETIKKMKFNPFIKAARNIILPAIKNIYSRTRR